MPQFVLIRLMPSWHVDIDFNTIVIVFFHFSIGIWSILFNALVCTEFKRRQWTSASLFRHWWDISILIVSGACEIPLGWHWQWQKFGTWLRAIHGCWCFNDHDWWRVSIFGNFWISFARLFSLIRLVFNCSGSQAIWMDENMRYGKTDSCTTFNNPPLCKSGDFEIRVLEVYGFIGA